MLYRYQLLLAMLAALALPVDAADGIDDILEQARGSCERLERGSFHADQTAHHPVDLNGDGVADRLVDESRFSCSSSSSLFSPNGGSILHALVSGKHYSWQALGWRLIEWGEDTVLLLARHGSYCGGYGYQHCYEAVVFNQDGPATVSSANLPAQAPP